MSPIVRSRLTIEAQAGDRPSSVHRNTATFLTSSDKRSTSVTILPPPSHYRIIIEKEGPYALWKGLGPNLVGVAPSRAIYFCSYSNAKKFFNRRLKPESPPVHMASAVCAGE